MKKKTERKISLSALFISFLALGLAWWQLELGRKHNKLSLKPLLTITPYSEGKDGKNGVFISNQGLGPAILKDFTVTIDGKTYKGLGENKWTEALKAAKTEPLCYKHGWPTSNSIIKVGEEIAILTPTAANIPICNLAMFVLQMGKNISISIEYESLYEEKYTVNGGTKMNFELKP
jgi:hypothetical protein